MTRNEVEEIVQSPWGHMGRYARSFNGGASRCLAIAIAAVAILMTPVEYRAGADLPHPHAMLQLIYEASRGIPAHHHAIAFEPTEHQHADTTHSGMTGDPTQNSASMHPGPGPDVAQQADVSLAVVVKLLTMLVPLIIALPDKVRTAGRNLRTDLLPPGIAVAPEPPPPRA